jgi:N-acetyl-beta-hexosaminidase
MDQMMTLVDSLFAAKMNVFHLHLTDSPSFPW